MSQTLWKHCSEPDAAGKWIESDLAGRYPHGAMEVFVRGMNQAQDRTWAGGFCSALQQVTGGCGRACGVLLRYDPGHPYGMICTAVCDCPKPQGACRERESRPRATLLLLHTGTRDILIGQRAAPLVSTGSRTG